MRRRLARRGVHMKRRKTPKYSIFIKTGRIAFVAGLVSLAFCAVFARLYYLHVVNSSTSIEATDKARKRFDRLEARRGDITDSRGNLLATSLPVITLGVDPLFFKRSICAENNVNPAELESGAKLNLKPGDSTELKLRSLALLLEMPYEELYAKCTGNGRWVKLAEINDSSLYEKISALKIKGVYGNRKYIRTYPSGALMAHVVGFVNKEFNPVMGAERQFDYYLRGQDGWIETERSANRKEVAQFRTRDCPPADGMNVELSIDLIMQEMAQREIRNIVEKYNPKNAAIIISEPSTGYILGMASYPSFDPNDYNKYGQDALRNHAISDQYEPGSTFKVVTISAALNESIVGPDDEFDCGAATVSYKGRILRLPKEAHPMSTLSVRDITKKSSNKGAAHLGILLGEKKLYEYSKLFGYGEKTNIGLIGEASGTLHQVKDWDGLTITRLPMGHAIAATPLQVHCAMSVIANQGIYMQPQIVKRIYYKDGNTAINYAPQAVRRVLSPKVASLMSEMLAEVVGPEGTARRASLDGFKVAGKTGTSQKIVNNRYSTKDHVASFSGFFPAQRPRLVITVVVDSPHLKGVGYGGIVAAPSFKSIAEQAANYLGIQSDAEFEKIVAWKGIK